MPSARAQLAVPSWVPRSCPIPSCSLQAELGVANLPCPLHWVVVLTLAQGSGTPRHKGQPRGPPQCQRLGHAGLRPPPTPGGSDQHLPPPPGVATRILALLGGGASVLSSRLAWLWPLARPGQGVPPRAHLEELRLGLEAVPGAPSVAPWGGVLCRGPQSDAHTEGRGAHHPCRGVAWQVPSGGAFCPSGAEVGGGHCEQKASWGWQGRQWHQEIRSAFWPGALSPDCLLRSALRWACVLLGRQRQQGGDAGTWGVTLLPHTPPPSAALDTQRGLCATCSSSWPSACWPPCLLPQGSCSLRNCPTGSLGTTKGRAAGRDTCSGLQWWLLRGGRWGEVGQASPHPQAPLLSPVRYVGLAEAGLPDPLGFCCRLCW